MLNIPKDTVDFIKTIEEKLHNLSLNKHDNIFIGIFKVVYLYTPIPKRKAICRITDFLQQNNLFIPAQSFTEITRYILNQ